MKRRFRTMACLLSAVLVGIGCSASSGTPDSSATSVTGATAAGSTAVTSSPAPASGAAVSSVDSRNVGAANVAASATDTSATATGSLAGTSTAPASTLVAAASAPLPGGTTAGAVATSPEALRKKAQIEWALKQDDIKNDPKGSWAVQAKASSSYNDAKGNAPYAASQATGFPNIEGYGNSTSAWTPKTPDAGIEWLELQYAKPVHATMVRVRESYGSGAVIKVELFDGQGAAHAVWTGADPTKDLDYLVVEFPKTAFKTGRVKLTLATNVVQGSNQIDAVQLVGTDQ